MTVAAEPRMLTTNEVAALFKVDPATVKRWVMPPPGCSDRRTIQALEWRRRLGAFKTPGGHWRFNEDRVTAVRKGQE